MSSYRELAPIPTIQQKPSFRQKVFCFVGMHNRILLRCSLQQYHPEYCFECDYFLCRSCLRTIKQLCSFCKENKSYRNYYNGKDILKDFFFFSLENFIKANNNPNFIWENKNPFELNLEIKKKIYSNEYHKKPSPTPIPGAGRRHSL